MQTARIGIIGCGVIGSAHVEAACQSERITLAAVADLIPERRERAAARSGAVPYASGAELLERADVDAVVLAVPASDRVDLPLQAMARGKHVLIEKPVAMNAALLQRYLDARGSLVAACCSSRFQALPSTQAAADFVASGALGPLRNVYCRILVPTQVNPAVAPPPWRLNTRLNAGGILCNWGCYDLDYLMTLTGWRLRPRRVLAQTWGVTPACEPYVAPDSDAETFYTAHIACDDNIALTVTRGEYLAAEAEAAWQIVGTDGSLRLNMLPGEDKTIVHDTYTPPDGVATRAIWTGSESFNLLHSGPIDDFARAILDGATPRTTLERAMLIQQITDAIYASASTGQAVEIA